MKPRFSIVLSLNAEDKERLEKLKEKGHKIIDVFREGLKSLLKLDK